MELDAELPLLGDDDAPTRRAWDYAAAAVLRKAGLMDAEDPDDDARAHLDGRTTGGVDVLALGTAEDVSDLPPVGQPGVAPYTRGSAMPAPAGWDIRAHVAEPDRERVASAVSTDLRHGVTSLWIVVGDTGTSPDDLDAMLADVHLDIAPVVVEADPTADPLETAHVLATAIDDRDAPAHPHTSFGVDPVGRLARYGQADVPGRDVDEAAAAAALAAARGMRGFVVDATVVHDAGGSEAQELGYALAAGVTYLRALESAGYAPDEAAGLLEFRIAATDEQFPTIAKLRAARALWHRVTELAGYPAGDRRQRQHAVTSRPMTTRYDPWVNMLRTTVAAFAAGVGGVEALTVLPFDHALGRPDTLARRIARNTSSVLIHESQLARVADPAGGAYAVEVLTDRMARAGWAEFQQLEASGGVVAALRSGELADRVALAWDRRRAGLARRVPAITGVSEYALADERLPVREPWPTPSIRPGPGALPVVSYAGEFEAMRDDPATRPVFVAALGDVAGHTARATFVQNLLTAGGIPFVTADVDTFRDHRAPVVILAAPDADDDQVGRDAVDRLRRDGARWVVLAGRPTAQVADLVDDTVRADDDAVAFLERTRARLSEVSR